MSLSKASFTQNNGVDDEKNPGEYLCEYKRAPMFIILSSGKRNPRLYSESHTTTEHHVRRRAEARRGVVTAGAPTTAYTDSSYADVSQISSSVSPLRLHTEGRPGSRGEFLL